MEEYPEDVKQHCKLLLEILEEMKQAGITLKNQPDGDYRIERPNMCFIATVKNHKIDLIKPV